MRYDRHGFPIPTEFERPAASRDAADFGRVGPQMATLDRNDAVRDEGFGVGRAATVPLGRQRPGAWKRWLLLAVIFGGVVPAIVVPQVLPVLREVVVQWSLERAAECEARSDIAGAVADISRAVRWFGDDADLLCMRAMLRLEERDATGCLQDAVRATEIAPTAVQPWRVRALVNVVLGDADAALTAADMVVNLSAPGDPDALNHRAYIRGLVGRDLPAALADIDRAIGAMEESSPEMLDTRGFLMHLAGRHEEAVDQLNLAITGMQQNRRKLGLLAGRVDPVQLACRVRGLEHGMAVMLHHRAMACRAVGLEEQAKQDFEMADRKGFDPSRGIF
jgi:tetratricopeptide (TPR) repeat protein